MSTLELSTVSQALQALEKEREAQGKIIHKLINDLMITQQWLSEAVDRRDALDQKAREILRAAHEDNVYKKPL